MFDALYGDLNDNNLYNCHPNELEVYCDIQNQMSAVYDDNLNMSKEEKLEPAPKLLEGEIKRETDKAILFKFGESENWMPKSQVKIKKKKEGCSVEIPDWLWKKMNEIEE